MKSFGRKPRFAGRDSNRSSDEEPRYQPRGDRPQRRSPSRFGRGEGRSEDRGSFGRRDSGRVNSEKQMFRVTCDKCGERCEVPFRPTEGKPVYCSNCFRKEGSSSRTETGRPDNNQEQFDKINQKLDKIMHMMGIHEETE